MAKIPDQPRLFRVTWVFEVLLVEGRLSTDEQAATFAQHAVQLAAAGVTNDLLWIDSDGDVCNAEEFGLPSPRELEIAQAWVNYSCTDPDESVVDITSEVDRSKQ